LAEPITSRAAILEKLGAPLVVDKIVMPKKLTAGQVLVRVRCSGICGTQIGEIDAKEDRYLPHLLGHEGAGEVVQTGPGVTWVRTGDHVVMHWRKGAGIESDFPRYILDTNKDAGPIGGGLVTTFNKHAVVSENRLTPIERDIPFDIAALMGCAVTTGLGVIDNEAHLRIGESIAVIGCGGVGLNVIQGAAMVSAYPIIAVDTHESKLEMAKSFGATYGFNAIKSGYGDVLDRIYMATGGADVVVECSGKADWAHKAVKPGGRLIYVGLPTNDSLKFDEVRRLFNGSTAILSQGGETDPNADIPRYLKLYRDGKLKLDSLITHRYKLDEINQAIDRVRSGDCGRCVIDMEDEIER